MIPNSFDYHRPESVKDAVALLAEHGDEARAIAGGHSLIPMMKLRMADVAHLVDLQAIDDLRGIAVDGDTITIGAMTTQHELIASDALAKAAPIIREAALQIADPQVRYVGTVGGNVANGDPGNDMPGLMQCLDATYVLTGPGGTREVAARDFYEAAYFTARADDELLVAIRFAAPKGGYAYEKQKRKIGDYATAAAAVLIEAEGGKIAAASIAVTNLSDTPVYCQAAADALRGTDTGNPGLDAAVAAMQGAIDPAADNRGPVDFKKYVAGVVLRRAIERAASRA
ncbi:MAG: xanthine dehydrogenase family protein subunit M [Rhizobiaceae bacterium]|nr:xanthine dehydrogenase family protein subunit M [Rhizobiaceae bacterium]